MPKGVYKRVKPPWNKGKKGVQKCSDKTREKMRNNNLGAKNPFYGKHHTEKTKKINSIKHKRENLSEETLNKIIKSRKGKSSWNKGLHPEYLQRENHPNWKGGLTNLTFQIRNSEKYSQWRASIFERDLFTCQNCGQIGGKLNVHHKKRFAVILHENNIQIIEDALLCNELWNLDNGITLCEECHNKKPKKKDCSKEICIFEE